VRRQLVAAVVVLAALSLVGCQAQPTVERTDDLTYLRVTGEMVAPATLFEVVVTVGEDGCLYATRPDDITPRLLALADSTTVGADGLRTPSGLLRTYGDPIEVEIPGPASGRWDVPDVPECTGSTQGLLAISFFEQE
jgi:hypothetical protein